MKIVTLQFWIGIAVAVLCGAIVGLERQMRGKPAGIRTSTLICLGTSIFIGLGVEYSGAATDPTRVLGQIVTGVGFIGAGVIIAREGLVTGVTTAAVIWVLAGIGATIGFGHFLEAVAIAVVTVGILTGVEFLEKGMHRLRKEFHAQGGEANQGEK
jgi:putative Mg2+ transporter-C (MgtC) family protein